MSKGIIISEEIRGELSDIDFFTEGQPRSPWSQCNDCAYMTGEVWLNCAVNPCYQGGECKDFEAR